jgi:peptidoglycan hydrolase CwlO-like protein
MLLTSGISAGAAPPDIQATEVETQDARERLKQIRVEASVSYEAYDSALLELNQVDGQIERTEKDLAVAKERASKARRDFEERASQVYKSGNLGFIDVLVGVDDFSEFATRLDLWMKLLTAQRAEFEAVRDAKDELVAKKNDLENQRQARTSALEDALAEKNRGDDAEVEARAYLASLNGELRAAIEAEQTRRAAEARDAVEAAASNVEVAPAPVVQTAQVARAEPAASQADLRADRQAAEQRAAERAERRAAAEKAAKEAERQVRIAEQAVAEKEAQESRVAERAATEQKAVFEQARAEAEQRAEQQRIAAEKARREAQKTAIEQAAAERAAACSPPNSKLRNSKLRNSKLRNSKLRNSKLRNSKLRNSKLRNKRFWSLHRRRRHRSQPRRCKPSRCRSQNWLRLQRRRRHSRSLSRHLRLSHSRSLSRHLRLSHNPSPHLRRQTLAWRRAAIPSGGCSLRWPRLAVHYVRSSAYRPSTGIGPVTQGTTAKGWPWT